MFILSTFIKIEEEPLKNLIETLQKIYPDKSFKIISIQFNPFKDIYSPLIENDEHIISCDGKIEIFRYKRRENNYDYNFTNIEWCFLDNIELKNKLNKSKFELIKFGKLKKGISVKIFPTVLTIISLNLYLFGMRFSFSIGKHKEKF